VCVIASRMFILLSSITLDTAWYSATRLVSRRYWTVFCLAGFEMNNRENYLVRMDIVCLHPV
jgi:hypothetical protein